MTRGKGEGSVYKRASDGLWCVRIELPSHGGKRRTKVVCRKSKPAAIAELNRLQMEAAQEEPSPADESLTLEQATAMILSAIQEQRVKQWHGVSRRQIR